MNVKGLNFKTLLIDHGEKIGLGVIGLCALLVLASTNWKPTDKRPEEIERKATEAQRRIVSTPWPKPKQEEFQIVDFSDRAMTMLRSLNVAQYDFSTNMFWPLYRKRELAKEPEVLPVEYLHAKAGLVSLAVQSATEESPLDSTSPLDESTNEEDNEFASRSGAAGGAAPGAFGGPIVGLSPGGPAAGGGHAGPPGGPGGPRRGPGAMPPASPPGPPRGGASGGHAGAGGAMGPAMGPAGMDAYMAGFGGGMGGGHESRGQRFIAVRGVYPLRQQQERIQKALSLDSVTEASSLVELLDCVIERQQAVAGADPWSGTWEPVSLKTAIEILEESPGYDLDPVDPIVTDPVITMPLPMRLMGFWGEYATHPRIKNFELSPQAQEQRAKLEKLLLEEAERARLQEPSQPERRGLSTVQRDFRALGNQLINSEGGGQAYTNMYRNMMSDPSMAMRGANGAQPLRAEDLAGQFTAAGQLLLFRFLDFDVQPGLAYRYRVKIKVRNPNYGRPPEQAVDGAVVEGMERESPWSEISNPAVVPSTTDYFLTGVERDPIRDPYNARQPVAALNYFEWVAKYGTWIKTSLELSSIGNYIMEKKKVEYLDPGKQEFKEEDDLVGAQEVLVDVLSDLPLSPEDHPDLKIAQAKGSKTASAGLTPLALVVDRFGVLHELDPSTDDAREKSLEERYKGERDAHKWIKEKPEGSALDQNAYPGSPAAGGPAMGGAMGGSMANYMQQYQNTRKTKKKSSGKGAAAPTPYPGG